LFRAADAVATDGLIAGRNTTVVLALEVAGTADLPARIETITRFVAAVTATNTSALRAAGHAFGAVVIDSAAFAAFAGFFITELAFGAFVARLAAIVLLLARIASGFARVADGARVSGGSPCIAGRSHICCRGIAGVRHRFIVGRATDQGKERQRKTDVAHGFLQFMSA
jgi:hypothetical protein